MKDKAFIDSNVLIYLYSDDEIGKKEIAEGLIAHSLPVISIQVLSEIANVMMKKMKLQHSAISKVIDELSAYCIVRELTVETVRSAINLSGKYFYSYYDSLIIASSLENHCNILYSEDMQHGQHIEDRLEIFNPFSAV